MPHAVCMLPSCTMAAPCFTLSLTLPHHRRKLKLADGEDSEERSADDCDSDNEELKRSKKARYEDTGGLGGFGGFGGFGALFGVGGGYSDDDEEGYSSDGGYIYGYD